jgi:hypothetical protein
MRICDGARKIARNGGYVHVLTAAKDHRAIGTLIPVLAPSRHDLPLLARQFRSAVNPARLRRFAESLGLTVAGLERLGVGWSVDHGAWSFPMLDAAKRVVGIRLRTPGGAKFAVASGHEGLFVPADIAHGGELLVTEGPTDCAAVLDLGFDAIGRPSCTGGVKLLMALVNSLNPSRVAIVSDADEPGQRGAAGLAAVLAAHVGDLRIIRPPNSIKDVRAWKHRGATASDVRSAIDAAAIQRLRITLERRGPRR